MKKIDTAYDELLESNYDLFAVKFSDLQQEVKSWYTNINFTEFDDRTQYAERAETTYALLKMSAITSNHFYAYREQNGKMHLMDGFNRLLTSYGKFSYDPIVYIKILTDELSDNRLMNIMFRLNMWKLSNNGTTDDQFRVDNFLDRGFRLFMKTKFDIIFCDRARHDDMDVINQYFKDERESVAYFNYGISPLFRLFMNKRIVDDIKHILKHNDYSEPEFNHYNTFFEGYIRFLSRRRLANDMSDHYFETYLNLLKADIKFFNKLQKMSWTDSSRKNVYNFFNNFE